MSNRILTEYLPVDKLRPFEGHPFQVKDDEEMNQLVWSIITQGVLNPIMVRPLNTGEYEVISGHRRVQACAKAGIVHHAEDFGDQIGQADIPLNLISAFAGLLSNDLVSP